MSADLVNLAIPVIVGGIAGMTLSLTGVEKIHTLSCQVFYEVTKLDKKEFSLLAPYNKVLSDTYNLILFFFGAEIIAMFGLLISNDLPIIAGNVVLTGALVYMIIIYRGITKKIPCPELMKNTDPIANDFENVKSYPSIDEIPELYRRS
ncbi:MAG: hypothetical protein Q7V05_07670 [Methanoregula sp.]|nr:hypothetical protein [Methanoregula sp.]